MSDSSERRYAADELLAFASALFAAHGLAPERARAVASGFLEADLLGFVTHGLVKVPDNLRWLDASKRCSLVSAYSR